MTQPTRNGNGTKSSTAPIKFTVPMRTKQEAYDLGSQTATMLGNTVFSLTVQSLIAGYETEWGQTSPEEVKKREWLYTKRQAVGDMISDFNGIYQQAVKIEQEHINNENYTQQQNTAMTQANELYS